MSTRQSLIERSCIVVSPFTTPHFSVSALEAGLLRKPIIISDNGHAREMVLDGQSGLIVPSGNVRVLAEALNRLLFDASERQKMGNTGYDHVTTYFDQEVSMGRLLRIYNLPAGER